MKNEKIKIINQNGIEVEAQAPIIISASRSTDIPAFYSDWFIKRWEEGYIKWINPFNQQPMYVSFENSKCVVFWTKNPKPMMKHIDFLNKNVKNYYFQYSLNDYDFEKFEAKVPSVDIRIKTFKELSEKIGKDRVVWRYDPLILTDKIDVKELLRRVEKIGDELKNHTSKLVFSFADIAFYSKVQHNLKREDIKYIEFDTIKMEEFADGVSKLGKKWNLEIGTCSEDIDLSRFGIIHNKCIDDDLMIKLFSADKELMEFLGAKIIEPDLFSNEFRVERINSNLKDKGQRKICGCIISKDIGQYNTCPHECVYCYANTSKIVAEKNYNKHKQNRDSETIIPN